MQTAQLEYYGLIQFYQNEVVIQTRGLFYANW